MKKLTIGNILSILGLVGIMIGSFMIGKADAKGEESDKLLLVIGVVVMGVGVLIDYFIKKKKGDTIG